MEASFKIYLLILKRKKLVVIDNCVAVVEACWPAKIISKPSCAKTCEVIYHEDLFPTLFYCNKMFNVELAGHLIKASNILRFEEAKLWFLSGATSKIPSLLYSVPASSRLRALTMCRSYPWGYWMSSGRELLGPILI